MVRKMTFLLRLLEQIETWSHKLKLVFIGSFRIQFAAASLDLSSRLIIVLSLFLL